MIFLQWWLNNLLGSTGCRSRAMVKQNTAQPQETPINTQTRPSSELNEHSHTTEPSWSFPSAGRHETGSKSKLGVGNLQ